MTLYGKRSSMKQTIYQKLWNTNGNSFSFMLHVCYFSYHPWIAVSEGESLTTLLSTKITGAGNTAARISKSLSNSLIVPSLSLSSVKTIKKLRLINKSGMRETDIHRRLCIFFVQLLKTVSILSISSELFRTLCLVGLLSNL